MIQFYGFFATTNVVLLLAVFVVISMAPIQVMRRYIEKMRYQIPWSADFGGVALALIMLDAVLILQHGGRIVLPYGTDRFSLFAGVVSIVSGLVWTAWDWDTQWADRYHHLFVFPLQLFLLSTLLPVVVGWGTKEDKWISAGLLVLFCLLFYVDVKEGNLSQREKIKEQIPKFLDTYEK
jgi:hypothetical protein